MKIAIASGKGGTGKTTLATNLAWVAARKGRDVAYIDCDVEEPNGRLFLRPEITLSTPVGALHPVVDLERCTHCGLCGEICQSSAIVSIGQKVLHYPELCHSCGGCALVCRPGAIREEMRLTGEIEAGRCGGVGFVEGLLRIGEAMSVPVIRQAKAAAPAAELVILDSPPGTSCPVIESVRGADFVLLVSEPTPFGLHDLELAVEMVRALNLSHGVCLNRAGAGSAATQEYCRREEIPILAEIPDDRRVAEAYSRGVLASEAVPEFREQMVILLGRLEDRSHALPADFGREVRP